MEFPKYYHDPTYLTDVTPGMLNTIRHNWMLPCSICGCGGSIHERTTISHGPMYWIACKNYRAGEGRCSYQATSWHYRLHIKTVEIAINYWNFLQWYNTTKPFNWALMRKQNLTPSFFDDVVFT